MQWQIVLSRTDTRGQKKNNLQFADFQTTKLAVLAAFNSYSLNCCQGVRCGDGLYGVLLRNCLRVKQMGSSFSRLLQTFSRDQHLSKGNTQNCDIWWPLCFFFESKSYLRNFPFMNLKFTSQIQTSFKK